MYPSIDSILSAVPPVNPSPLPDILKHSTPSAATIGSTISVILSPTPPVECLSTICPTFALKSDKSSVLLEFAIANVKFTNSSLLSPLRYIAIISAEAW